MIMILKEVYFPNFMPARFWICAEKLISFAEMSEIAVFISLLRLVNLSYDYGPLHTAKDCSITSRNWRSMEADEFDGWASVTRPGSTY